MFFHEVEISHDWRIFSALLMSTYPWQNVKFLFLLDYLLEVNSGQAGRSNSMWSLTYHKIADFVVSNLQFNGAFGQISVDATFHYRFPVLREGRAFIDHPLEEGNWPRLRL